MSLKNPFALLVFGCALLGLGDAWKFGVEVGLNPLLEVKVKGGQKGQAVTYPYPYPVAVYPGGAGYQRQLPVQPVRPDVVPNYAGYPGLLYPVAAGYQGGNGNPIYVYPGATGY